MLDSSDEGIYGVIHVDGHLTDMRIRLVQGPDRWRLEEKKEDGSWEDETCEEECLLRISTPSDVAHFTRDILPKGWQARCQHNLSFAFCRMQGPDGSRQYTFVALITGTPIPMKLKYLGGS